MRLVRTGAQVAMFALAPSLAALAESGDSGAQQAGGAFMTSYPPIASAPTRAATVPKPLSPATQKPRP